MNSPIFDSDSSRIVAKHFSVNPFRFTKDYAHAAEELSRQAGGVAIFKVLGRKIAVISDASIASKIQYDEELFFGRSIENVSVLKPLLGDSIFTLDGKQWKDLRGSLNNSFSISNISKYYPNILRQIDSFLGLRQGEPKPVGSLNLDLYSFERFFLQHSAITLMGSFLPYSRCLKVHKSFADTENIARLYYQHPWLLLIPQWIPHPASLLLRLKAISLNKQLSNLIGSAIALSSSQPNLLVDINQEISKENRCPFSRSQRFSVVKSLFYASTKTSALTMVWIFTHLVRDLDHWRQLADEVRAKFGTRFPSWTELDDLPLLNNIVNETLRLTPIVPTLSRRVTRSCRIGGEEMNKNDTILLSVSGIHHSAENWNNPDQFLPERFNHDYNKNAFLPFQLGGHTCPGQHLARRTVMAFMIRLAQHFELTPISDVGLDAYSYSVLIPKQTLAFNFVQA